MFMFAQYFWFLMTKILVRLNTQSSTYWNPLLNNIGNTSKTTRVIFNSSHCRLGNHGKWFLCKGLKFAISPPKWLKFQWISLRTLYSLPECQGTLCSKQAPYLKLRTKWLWVRISLLSLKLQI